MEINKKVKMYLNESKLDRDVVNKAIDYLENTYQDIIKELTTELEKEKKKKKKTKVELVFHENFYCRHYGKLTINDKEVGELCIKKEIISPSDIELEMELTVKVPINKTDGRIYKLN